MEAPCCALPRYRFCSQPKSEHFSLGRFSIEAIHRRYTQISIAYTEYSWLGIPNIELLEAGVKELSLNDISV